MVAAVVKSGLALDFPPPAEVDSNEAASGESADPEPPSRDPWTNVFPPLPLRTGLSPTGGSPDAFGMFDAEDQVYRCLDCMHEIWGRSCSHCGRYYDGHNVDLSDDEALPEGHHAMWSILPAIMGWPRAASVDGSDGSYEASFIDDERSEGGTSEAIEIMSDNSNSVARYNAIGLRTRRGRRPGPSSDRGDEDGLQTVLSDDDENVSETDDKSGLHEKSDEDEGDGSLARPPMRLFGRVRNYLSFTSEVESGDSQCSSGSDDSDNVGCDDEQASGVRWVVFSVLSLTTVMGNTQSGYPLTRTAATLDSFINELGPEISCDLAVSEDWASLQTYQRRLKVEREALLDIPNVYSYQTFIDSDKAGYLIRQWVASNLYDRISTRPFLSTIEKKWIAFQLLNALRDARAHKIAHGDVKSENILVTSWNWVYLTDFASHKPTYLPLDDPSDFAFYFDTSGRRSCYIAPERFFYRAMDVFSAGCVIAELFREGAPLFTLSQLFKYREGELNTDGLLASVEDVGVRDLIKDMIALNPSARPPFDTLLHSVRGIVFPEVFYSFLHGYVSSINELPATTLSVPVPTTATSPEILTPATSSAASPTVNGGAVTPVLTVDAKVPEAAVPRDADHKLEKIWADYESVEPYLVEDSGEDTVTDVRVEYGPAETSGKPLQDILPVELCIPNRDSKLFRVKKPRSSAATEDGPALIILALVCTNVRNCSQPSSKLRALDVFLALSMHLTDEAKLDRLVPYIVDLLRDDTAVVRAAALRTLLQVLSLVNVIAPANASIFPDIIPNVHPLVHDLEVSVRSLYAQSIVPLADVAVRYLEMGQALKAHGTFKVAPDGVEYDEAQFEVPYDVALQDLQNSIQEHLITLLVDQSSVVKRAVLRDVSSMCIFLGRQRTNDILLSHMITYLNDRDWLIRYAFFDAIVDVAAYTGGRSLEERHGIYCLCSKASPSQRCLGDPLPSPSLRHFLRDVRDVDEFSLLTALKPPLERQIFDAALQWAMKADKTHFWRGYRKFTKLESPQDSVGAIRKASTPRVKTDEDENQLAKLRQLGMTPIEEMKLVSMRDYILKLANAISSDEESEILKTTAHVELQKLKVVPQTVFLRTRATDMPLARRGYSQALVITPSTILGRPTPIPPVCRVRPVSIML
ncbi:hypothetical protein EDB83DRAFT_2520935 [Lactarius deliciosus]|nr:hypothetical protein EDB83DRAFT_2520935 [Lactarius deliciosus]